MGICCLGLRACLADDRLQPLAGTRTRYEHLYFAENGTEKTNTNTKNTNKILKELLKKTRNRKKSLPVTVTVHKSKDPADQKNSDVTDELVAY